VRTPQGFPAEDAAGPVVIDALSAHFAEIGAMPSKTDYFVKRYRWLHEYAKFSAKEPLIVCFQSGKLKRPLSNLGAYLANSLCWL
jgi:hypothetical protein